MSPTRGLFIYMLLRNRSLKKKRCILFTWIDTIFLDACDSFPSRHDIITATIDVFYPLTANENYSYKSINKITSQDLNSNLRDLNWSIFATDDKFDAKQGLALLTDNLQKAIDSLAPDKKLNTKKSLYPWIDTELKLLISKRDATRRRYERTGS